MMNILESSNLGGYKEVINEVEHQRALMMNLHDLVLPILDPCSGQAKLIQQLFEEVFSSSGKIISSLELGDNSEKQAILIKHKGKGGKDNVENHILEENNKDRGNKRRKNANHISSVVTQTPYFDGCHWRKYGQKWISRAKHSRCAYSKEQGCPATKTVQQKENDGNGTVRLFNVNYYGQHICNSDGIVHPHVVGATQDSMPIVSQNQNSSSVFVNTDVHGVQDEIFESLFMVPDMPEYLTEFVDVEMARAFEITPMNSPMIPEDIWA
ncbi:hypothetical protein SORBI_3005G013800 [Sorghum bicolor]|uniref:WRKY domain-containing protein n=1 Tax=Sorghum bicolor TaxID=4558 RepID=A0A1Z5RG53_SORBI|nr:hypothetical protein SORBI_3005G013800 [Sorghum bicolor]